MQQSTRQQDGYKSLKATRSHSILGLCLMRFRSGKSGFPSTKQIVH
jgi:hypothetical protein